MASLSSKSNQALQFPFRMCFDLDEALAIDANSSSMQTVAEVDASRTLQEVSYSPSERITNSSELVLELPSVEGVDVRCTICMEGFMHGTKDGKQVPCGHVFHASCISLWLSFYNSCPLCRFKLSN